MSGEPSERRWLPVSGYFFRNYSDRYKNLTSILECNCSGVAHICLFRSLKHTCAIREGRNEQRWDAPEQLPFFYKLDVVKGCEMAVLGPENCMVSQASCINNGICHRQPVFQPATGIHEIHTLSPSRSTVVSIPCRKPRISLRERSGTSSILSPYSRT